MTRGSTFKTTRKAGITPMNEHSEFYLTYEQIQRGIARVAADRLNPPAPDQGERSAVERMMRQIAAGIYPRMRNFRVVPSPTDDRLVAACMMLIDWIEGTVSYAE